MQDQAEIQTPTFSSDRSCRALVAMSGGVDSAVAAYLMQQQGYACTGATMRLFPGSSPQEAQDARAVSETLGMKHIVLDYTALFAQTVIDRFVHDYEMGRTPNPCIVCNRSNSAHCMQPQHKRDAKWWLPVIMRVWNRTNRADVIC